MVTDDTKKEEDNASKNTNAVSQMGSTTTNHEKLSDDAAKANAAGSDGETEDEMYKMGDKFTTVCNTLIAAKCTAVQQIAKDYMTIIRAHVKSYVGNTDNKADDRTAKAGTNYQKDKNNDNSNQQGENSSGEQEQKKPQQTGIKTIDQINAEITDLTDKIAEGLFGNMNMSAIRNISIFLAFLYVCSATISIGIDLYSAIFSAIKCKFDESFLFSDNVTPVVVHPQARHPYLWYLFFEYSFPNRLSF